MSTEPEIHLLREADIDEIVAAFAALDWNKPAPQYQRYVAQQTAGQRTVLVARVAGVFAGYVTIVWQAEYAPFRAAGIPEIQDFNVLPQFRRRGIGTQLLDRAEALIAERSPIAGIGVGLFADYGAAQRMYPRRGYVPNRGNARSLIVTRASGPMDGRSDGVAVRMTLVRT